MLMITLREGDYFLVGDNVKITYERAEGKDSVFIGVDAPREVPVLRGKIYEERIAKQAAAGDYRAQVLNEKLMEEYETRSRKYNTRRASRKEHERRKAAGEIR